MPRNVRSHLNPRYKPVFVSFRPSQPPIRFYPLVSVSPTDVFLSPFFFPCRFFSFLSFMYSIAFVAVPLFFYMAPFLSSNKLAITSQPLFAILFPSHLLHHCVSTAQSVTPRATSCSNSSSGTIIRCYVS